MSKTLNKPEQDRRMKEFLKELWGQLCNSSSLDFFELQDLFIKYKLVKKGFAPKDWSEEYGSQFWYTLHKWIDE